MSVFCRQDLDQNPHIQAFRARYDHFTAILHGMCIYVTPTCWYRSTNVQAMLYAQGRTTPGHIVTNAPPGESPHNYALAMDSIYTDHRPALLQKQTPMYELISKAAHTAGLTWGGNFKRFPDKPHVELPNWKKVYRL